MSSQAVQSGSQRSWRRVADIDRMDGLDPEVRTSGEAKLTDTLSFSAQSTGSLVLVTWTAIRRGWPRRRWWQGRGERRKPVLRGACGPSNVQETRPACTRAARTDTALSGRACRKGMGVLLDEAWQTSHLCVIRVRPWPVRVCP